MAEEVPPPPSRMYEAELKRVPSDFATLLEKFADVPKGEQINHVLSVRNQAYKYHPYPCLGRFRFLDLDLSNHPLYQEVLARLKSSDDDELLLDFGCCLGQDIRKLVSDGAPVPKVYGSDLRPEFIEVGYELFRDKSTWPEDHFIAPADAFDVSSNNALAVLDGRVSILHVCAVFHLFDIEDQRKLARKCLNLLNHKKKCIVLGGQTANIKVGYYAGTNGKMRWRHNAESWASFWEEAAKEHGGCTVKSISHLHERQFDARKRKSDDSINLDRSKIIGQDEAGFRWMVWWTLVKFYSESKTG